MDCREVDLEGDQCSQKQCSTVRLAFHGSPNRQTRTRLILALLFCISAFGALRGLWKLGVSFATFAETGGGVEELESDIVTFQLHSSTAAQVERIKGYADQLEGVADVWATIDVTPGTQLPDPPIKTLFKDSKNVHVFEFKESDLESRYPNAIRNVMHDYKLTGDWKKMVNSHPDSILAYTHRDSVLLEFWHFVGRPSNRRIWFFEADVGISGSIRSLIMSYRTDVSDLIRGDKWLRASHLAEEGGSFWGSHGQPASHRGFSVWGSRGQTATRPE